MQQILHSFFDYQSRYIHNLIIFIYKYEIILDLILKYNFLIFTDNNIIINIIVDIYFEPADIIGQSLVVQKSAITP